jgi:hypothetical protein
MSSKSKTVPLVELMINKSSNEFDTILDHLPGLVRRCCLSKPKPKLYSY